MSLFQELKRKGEVGEMAVINHYQKKGCAVEDVSDNPQYFKYDIDILINGQTVEVKTDYRMYETGNLLLEMVSNSNPAYYKEGWFITSKAQVFVFYSPQTNSTYQVFADELRKVVFDNQSQLKYRNMRVNEFGNVIKETQICLVPINFVRNNCETFRQEVMD